MYCKYKELITETEVDCREGPKGEPVLIGEHEVLIGEYCHKKEDYVDADDCNSCKHKD
jgi:hypothetical protein